MNLKIKKLEAENWKTWINAISKADFLDAYSFQLVADDMIRRIKELEFEIQKELDN